MNDSLNSKVRSYLRSLAHHLDPVVQLGKSGASPAVVDQISEQLQAHELIKVRFLREAPVTVADAAEELATATRSQVVQIAGRVLVLYRRHTHKPKIQLPGKEGKAAADAAKRDPKVSLNRKHKARRVAAERAQGLLPEGTVVERPPLSRLGTRARPRPSSESGSSKTGSGRKLTRYSASGSTGLKGSGGARRAQVTAKRRSKGST